LVNHLAYFVNEVAYLVTPFHRMSVEETRTHRETVLLRLLIRTQQAETKDLVQRLEARGHVGVSQSAIGVLGNLDTEGTRLVVLAARTGSSRQAVSQLVKEIEARGYVERLADPDDGRAVLVRHSPEGRRLLADALAEMADIEQGYEAVIGPTRMATLKRTLAMLADAVEPSGRLR
jgi:DNA-binding MarR family transcriptional regulator